MEILLEVAQITGYELPLNFIFGCVIMALSIFQSYAHQDWKPAPAYTESRLEIFVDVIRQNLGANDHRRNVIWRRDSEGALRYGDDVDSTIEKIIDKCDVGLVILSKSYVASENCTKEFDLLVSSGKPFWYFS